MSEDQILDQPMDEAAKKKDVMRNLAGGGKRFANYILDTIAYYIIIFIIAFIGGTFFGESDELYSFVMVSFYLGWLLYYWAFESLTGKTVGKYITRTKIVKADGSHPTGINVLGRTLSRLIPFEAFSFLGSPGKGWHDSIPEIYVINEK